MNLTFVMITASLEYKDVEDSKEFLSSPVDSPQQGEVGDTVCGLSATASESFSQPNSWSNYRDSPGGKDGSGLASYMPIVDEDDCPARGSPDGHTSSEEEQPSSPSACVAAFYKAAYEQQVHRWQQVESFYMKHEGWCEHRVILLLQEAFRCSYANLKRARAEGTLGEDVFAARAAELRNSLTTIKREYRRTLERTKERHGDLSSIASKAVTCIASVYPWSSEGFMMGFEENLKYADLTGITDSSTRRVAPIISTAASGRASVEMVPPSSTAALSMAKLELETAVDRDGDEGDDLGITDSVVAGGRSRCVATPRVSLRPLPPRWQLLQQTSATTGGEGSPVASPARDCAPATVSFSSASPPTGPRSPVPLPSPSIAGPIRAGEARFLEKQQLAVRGTAFVSRSLASTSFIASRRAAIAAATMRRRLGLARTAVEEGEVTPLVVSPPSSFTSRREAPPSQPPPRRLFPLVLSPSLPTRYIPETNPTPSEAVAFDSYPNNVTPRSSPCSVTKRTIASSSGSPNLMDGALSNNPPAQPSAFSDPMSGPGVLRGQPHSYTMRPNTCPVVIQSHPHSYTARSNPMAAPPYAAGLPAYGQAIQAPSDYSAMYARPFTAALPASTASTAPLPPPGYNSYVRRGRLRAQPASSLSSYSAMPPVSVADDEYVKELW